MKLRLFAENLTKDIFRDLRLPKPEQPTFVDLLKNDEIALVMNTTEGQQAINDSRDIRAVALYDRIPYFTTAAASISVVAAMKARLEGEIAVRTLQG